MIFNINSTRGHTGSLLVVYYSELSRLYGINENATKGELSASGDQGQDKGQSS